MKTISKNDILELVEPEEGDKMQPRFYQNPLQHMDERCKYTMSMIQAWGMMATFCDAINNDKDRSAKPIPPQELVMRVCEVVDAAFNEMKHRGWILDGQKMGE